ncbi:MAG: response regulator [Candidatus Thiodiazotropha lotti]
MASNAGERLMGGEILVVDDEPNIVLSLEFLMKKAGYNVTTANNGVDALSTIKQLRPDLVLLDVMMPRMDGYEVCQAVRGDPELSSVRIIMLTARGRDVERDKGMALGADDYVTKPFATQELVEKVKSLLDHSSS